MKKKLYLFLLLFSPVAGFSQQQFGVLDANNIQCHVSSTGDLFYDFGNTNLPGFEVPAGSGLKSIYGANLWIGGIDISQTLRIAAEMYELNGQDWYCGPLTNDGTASTDEQVMEAYNRVWVANSADVQSHVLYHYLLANGLSTDESFPNGYTIPDWFYEWPAHGDVSLGQDYYLAPFYDYDADGVYQPENGDYPLFCGDRCVLFMFNDMGGIHTDSGGEQIGLQIMGMLYGFTSIDAYLNNTVFVKYRILNQGTHTLQNTRMGMWCDFDLGSFNDDFIATDVERGAVYAYNGDDYDDDGLTNGYGSDLALQGLVMLRGPFADADFSDNPIAANVNEAVEYSGIVYESLGVGYGDGVFDNECLGMGATRYYNNNSNPTSGEPTIPIHYYNYLGNSWKNGQLLTHGENGTNSESVGCRYMFEGNSDPLFWSTNGEAVSPWTETTAGNQPGDRRMIISSGEFTLEPGELNYLDFAFVFARESDNDQPLQETFNARVDSVRAYFLDELIDCQVQPIVLSTNQTTGSFDFSIFPNPVDDLLNLEIPSFLQPESVVIYDAAGRTLLNETFKPGMRQINVSAVPAGAYLIQINTDSGAEVKALFVR
jgi:hypothetical protein